MKLHRDAERFLVGGVNSPVRAFKSVGGRPFFAKRADGSRLYDTDGNEYIDLVTGYGAVFIGHSHSAVIKAISAQSVLGTCYGVTAENEITLARLINGADRNLEKIRFVNSGTEACMTAIRLARAFTKRKMIIKFDGCYHGHSDSVLVNSGSGGLTYSQPTSVGIPAEVSGLTVSLPYNDARTLKSFIAGRHRDIAAIIVEPVACNMGLVPPADEFLSQIDRAKRYGILVIYDEVITGFRFTYGTFQKLIGFRADITTLGKIIGGGFPLAAVAGRADIMNMLSPEGPVYQAGTLSGNPVAVKAGIAVLEELKKTKPYKQIERSAGTLRNGMLDVLRSRGLRYQLHAYKGCMTLFFTGSRVTDLNGAMTSDKKAFSSFFWRLLKSGVFIPPSQYETWFITPALTDADINHILKSFEMAVK